MGVVYLATCLINGKQYVGKTIETMEDRMEDHLGSSREDIPDLLFHKAIKKYGWSNFVWEVLFVSDDESALMFVESLEISERGTFGGGYNMTTGGEGWSLSEETKKRISGSLKGRKKPVGFSEKLRESLRIYYETHTSWKRGVPHTEEQKRKVAQKLTGIPHTEERRARQSAARKEYWRKRKQRSIKS